MGGGVLKNLDGAQDLLYDVVTQVLTPTEVKADEALAGRVAMALQAPPLKVLCVRGQLGHLVQPDSYTVNHTLGARVCQSHDRVALYQLDTRDELLVVVRGVDSIRELQRIRQKLNLVHEHFGCEWHLAHIAVGVETEPRAG